VPPTPAAPTAPAATAQPVEDTMLAAALRAYDAVPMADCKANNPSRKQCVEPQSDPATLARGIAQFGVSDAGLYSSFAAFWGRGGDGAWRPWLELQNAKYELTRLPGDVLVCTGGDRLNLRAGPGTDARVVGQLAHLSRARAEEFVLTQPWNRGAPPGQSKRGRGWYHLSVPQDG
jgi:hypothetical protein